MLNDTRRSVRSRDTSEGKIVQSGKCSKNGKNERRNLNTELRELNSDLLEAEKGRIHGGPEGKWVGGGSRDISKRGKRKG